MNKIVIMAGGTGGHVYPGLAVADVLKQQKWHVEWFGTADKMEAQAVPNAGYRIHFLDVKGVRGNGMVGKLKMPFMLFNAVLKARKLLQEIKPHVVLGMGGYASGPGGLAAKTLGIPIVVHEQNAVFGMTNRWLSKIAKRVLCGFDVSKTTFANTAPKNIEFVGNPVRAAFFANTPAQIPEQPIGQKKCHILVLGGSLGALALNQIVPPILALLSQQFSLQIMHQAGKNKAQSVVQAYQDVASIDVKEFIDDMASALKQADIVICRAGALTVAEIASVGRTAIFVPLPIAVDDHQTYNAKTLSQEGAAILISQQNLNTELPMQLNKLLKQPELVKEMAGKARRFALPNASVAVAQACIEAGVQHE